MSEDAEVSAVETASEASFAEFFDPAALEARLVEARARREKALERRSVRGGEAGLSVTMRTARVRTVDMSAVAAPGVRDAGLAARPLGIATAARARGPVPAALPPSPSPARLVPRPPTASSPLHGRGVATEPERLAAVAAAAPTPASARWNPLAILSLGVAAGVMLAAATLLALRAPEPETPTPTAVLAPGTTRSTAVERPGPRFGVPVQGDPAAKSGAVVLSHGVPGDGAVGPVPDAASETRRKSTLPVAATDPVLPSVADKPPSDTSFAVLRATDTPPAVTPDAPALRRAPSETALLGPEPAIAGLAIGSGYAAFTRRPAVPASPAAEAPPRLRTRAAPLPATGTEPRGAEPTASARLAREPGHLALPAPPQTAVSAAAPRLKDDSGLRRADPVASARPASARSPVAFRPPVAALQTPLASEADAAPQRSIGDDAEQPLLSYGTRPPADGTVAALAWPVELAVRPAVAYALLVPPPEKPAPAVERPAPTPARERSAPQPVAERNHSPVRNAVADAVARARLKRSVEDMLRDRLFQR